MRLFVVATTGLYPFEENGPSLALYAILKGMLEASRFNSIEIAIELLIAMNDSKYLNINRCPLLNASMISTLRNLRSVHGLKANVDSFPKAVAQIMNADIIFYNAAPVDLITLVYPFAARLARKRQMYYLHGSLINENIDSISRKYFNSIARLGFFDKVIIPLESFKNYVSELICPYEIITTIPECVVTPWYEGHHKIPLQGDPSILYVGRLAQVKRIDALLKAFSILASEYPSAMLYLAGSGPLESHLKNLCVQLRLSKKTLFLGHVKHEDLRALYRSADIFVIPSDAEFMSISLLEAMASKCAVIASDIAATEVIESGQNGLVFPCGDFKALANNLSILADNKTLRKELADQAFLTVKKKFDYRVVASKLIKEMRNTLIQ